LCQRLELNDGDEMNKTDVTAAFEQSSFLYGGNAKFVEELYNTFKQNAAAVDIHWRQFFSELENGATAHGPSWAKANWPLPADDELTAALDGDWVNYDKAHAPPPPKGAKPAAPTPLPVASATPPADEVRRAGSRRRVGLAQLALRAHARLAFRALAQRPVDDQRQAAEAGEQLAVIDAVEKRFDVLVHHPAEALAAVGVSQ